MPHTPGPCGCNVRTEYIDTGIGGYDEHHIDYCPMHKAAPELLQMVKEFIQDYQEMGIGDKQTVLNAQVIITKAEKGA